MIEKLFRRLTVVLGVLLLTTMACTPARESNRRWERRAALPQPTPWRPLLQDWAPAPRITPAPQDLASGSPSPPTLAPTPNRRGIQDRTRDPLAWSIHSGTSPSQAAAMRLVDRARAELEAGTAGRAFELLDEAVRADPDCVPAYLTRAQASLLVGSTGDARRDLQLAVALKPKGAWLAELVAVNGEVYEVEGDEDSAIASYRRALGIYPANRTARVALTRLLAR
jgi:hypothetical protein